VVGNLGQHIADVVKGQALIAAWLELIGNTGGETRVADDHVAVGAEIFAIVNFGRGRSASLLDAACQE
jgi:hypothetical protein